MSDFSAHREQETLEAMRDGGLEISLHLQDEGNDPDGSDEVSESDTGYERAETSESDWDISGDGPTTMENNTEIDFGQAQDDWGEVEYFALWTGADAETSTVELAGAPHDITTGEEISIPQGELTVEVD